MTKREKQKTLYHILQNAKLADRRSNLTNLGLAVNWHYPNHKMFGTLKKIFTAIIFFSSTNALIHHLRVRQRRYAVKHINDWFFFQYDSITKEEKTTI